MKLYRSLAFLFVVSVFLSMAFNHWKEREVEIDELAQEVQQTYLSREQLASEWLSDVSRAFRKQQVTLFSNETWVRALNAMYDSEGFIFMVSRADSIMFMSHNALPLDHYKLPQYNSGMLLLDNGWYHVLTKTHDDYLVWLFSVVKHSYKYKNKFLSNDFEKSYHVPDYLQISTNSTGEGVSVYNREGDYAFSVSLPDGESKSKQNALLWFWSILTGMISLFVVVFFLFRSFSVQYNKGHPIRAVSGFFLSLVLVRGLIFYFQIPGIFYEGELFSARHFAASYWVPSLGDLLLNVLFAVVFSYFLFYKTLLIKNEKEPVLPGITVYILSFVMLFVLALSALIVHFTLMGLVINSSLHLNVKFIFEPDIYHVLGFFILTGIFLFYFFIGYSIQSFIKRNLLALDKGRWFLFFSFVVLAIAFPFMGFKYYLLWLGVFSASFITLFSLSTTSMGFSLSRVLLSFLVYALLSTYGLFVINKEKELATRENVSLRIASEQDPVAEFLFSEIAPDLLDDYVLTQMIVEHPFQNDSISDYLRAIYFTDFWAKYDIQTTICAPGDVLIVKPNEEEMICDDFFRMYVDNVGKPTHVDEFLYLDNNSGRTSYLAIIPIKENTLAGVPFTLYIEFESRFIPKELGFPELLVDEQIDITRNLGDYSYAIYKNGMLTNKYGSYFYNINIDSYDHNNEHPFVVFETDEYSHLLYNRDSDTRVIVSKPRETLLEKIAPFSYLFIFFLIYAIIIWILVYYNVFGFRFSFNFKNRLQFTIIGIVLISVVAIGSASAWFIFNIYKNKNEAFVNEKAHSILIEMENSFSQEDFLDESYGEFLDQMLLDLSQVFFTDINIFTPDGSLLSSSRPKVFNEGLIAPFIDPVAYNSMNNKGKSLYIHNEKIGNLEYISAYVPLRNINGTLIAYINLPYFAQQSELRNEISYFLVAFLNIYLLLLLLSVVIAVFISNHVTRPLQVIRDSFSRLSIGKNNEKINWHRNDEIGQLISEYNRMISELEISAELLAQSERESAWREMAKQVAHEIKNPLTPMRLNVQYLQRAWKDRAEDWDERLERFTKTMVEQIDNLSLIAGEFSDFAKMPSANNDRINLQEFIPEIPDLYKGFDEVEISWEIENQQSPMIIFADRKQLLRVFNNLIRNSMQAYPKSESARILIKAKVEANYSRIEIQDFGGGIADDLKKNIFQPYFTTKTAGMGLGLAMVKSIIQSFNGHISFESQKDKGTSFIIRIPLVK